MSYCLQIKSEMRNHPFQNRDILSFDWIQEDRLEILHTMSKTYDKKWERVRGMKMETLKRISMILERVSPSMSLLGVLFSSSNTTGKRSWQIWVVDCLFVTVVGTLRFGCGWRLLWFWTWWDFILSNPKSIKTRKKIETQSPFIWLVNLWEHFPGNLPANVPNNQITINEE